MLEISAIAGNIHDGTAVLPPGHERLLLSRADLARGRMRRTTETGTDIGLALEPGSHLRDGDILESDNTVILVEQEPETVMSVKLGRTHDTAENRVLLGHMIGNLHRPISVEDGSVLFPIQAESERETFEMLFKTIGPTEIKTAKKVFHPHKGADVHEH